MRSARRFTIVLLVSCTALLVAAHGDASAAPCWRPPVDAEVIDPFRAPECPYCAGNRGIEYGTPPGVPVRAVAAGTVTFAGSIGDDSYLVVRHADGRRTTYGNVTDLRFGRGDVVVARSVVGRTRGPLHFGLRVGGEYVDPAPHLGELRWRPRLVPLDGRAANPAPPPTVVCGASSSLAVFGVADPTVVVDRVHGRLHRLASLASVRIVRSPR